MHSGRNEDLFQNYLIQWASKSETLKISGFAMNDKRRPRPKQYFVNPRHSRSRKDDRAQLTATSRTQLALPKGLLIREWACGSSAHAPSTMNL